MKKIKFLFLVFIFLSIGILEKVEASAYTGLAFIAEQANTTVKLSKINNPGNVELQYKKNTGNWLPYSIEQPINLDNSNDSVLFRATETNDNFCAYSQAGDISRSNYYQFVISGLVSLDGSIMYLLSKDANVTSMPSYSFTHLFKDCKIKYVSETLLPATTLSEACYFYMFANSTIENAPNLPALEIENISYDAMFYQCVNLTTPPQISATTISDGTYNCMWMFKDCSSLQSAPTLKITTLTEGCFWGMFEGCSNLKKVNVAFTDWNESEGSTDNWLSGVPATGTFICPTDLDTTTRDASHVPNGWTVTDTDPSTDPIDPPTPAPTPKEGLKFIATQANTTISLTHVGSTGSSLALEYSLKGSDWQPYTIDTPLILSAVNDTLIFRAKESENTHFSVSISNYYQFKVSGQVSLAGKIMYLLSKDASKTDVPEYAFYKLFSGCNILSVAETLLPTTIVIINFFGMQATLHEKIDVHKYGYAYMFEDCASLTAAPNISATTVYDNACQSMFSGCSSLQTPPTIAIDTLNGNFCMASMFKGCTSLKTAPELNATALQSACYMSMFEGCTSLKTIPDLSAMNIADNCYNKMFKGCTSLETAPALPATELKLNCYAWMFEDCSNLTAAPVLNATTLATSCYNSMFKGCSKLKNSPELKATPLAERCYISMFENCTALETAPELQAETLLPNCYKTMFRGCSKLMKAPSISATTLADNSCQSMFENCTALETPPELKAETLQPSCYKAMFKGCTALETPPALKATTLAESCCDSMFANCVLLKQSPHLLAPTLTNKCYQYMFAGCASLNRVDVEFTSWNPSPYATLGWMSNVASTGTFYGPCELKTPTRNISSIPPSWRNDRSACERCGVTFIATTGSARVALSTTVSSPGSFEYLVTTSTTWDTAEWHDYPLDKDIALKYNDTLYIRTKGMNRTFSNAAENYKFAVTEGQVRLAGKVIYLLSHDGVGDEVPAYAFRGLFESCGIQSVADTFLSATTVGAYGYARMFAGCNSLQTAPNLPTTTIGDYSYASMFEGCTSLETTPTFNAAAMASNGYNGMFRGCTKLNVAPELPASILADSCYFAMFEGCKALTAMPTMGATSLARSCYESMFAGCEALENTQSLSVTTLQPSCYKGMFKECISLVNAPIIGATTLAPYSCDSMFAGCVSLGEAPSLEAEDLAEGCYRCMFYGCKQLPRAPYLPATTLVKECYQYMFTGCSLLDTVEVAFTSWGASSDKCTENWLSGVTATGTFICPTDLDTTTRDASHVPNGWTVPDTDPIDPPTPTPTPKNGLKFIATQANTTISLTHVGSTVSSLALEYSLKGSDWQTYTIETPLTLSAINDTLIFRSQTTGNTNFSTASNNNYQFTVSGQVSLAGNIMYLLSQDASKTDVPEYAFYKLFSGCNILSVADTLLPATTVNKYGYAYMFENCASLTAAPNISATTVYDNACQSMFAGCSALQTPPTIAVNTLNGNYCMASMFKGCTRLERAPELKASTLQSACYMSMFEGCTSLKTIPDLSAMNIADNCYNMMFKGCTALETAPSLPATELKLNCYAWMFEDCSNLKTIPAFPTPITLAQNCYNSMFKGCTSLTTAPALPATTLANNCYISMFENCTALETAPELQAETLLPNCYKNMFRGCSKLMKAPSISATTLADNSCQSMFENCTALETPPELKAETLQPSCYKAMFKGCTALETPPALKATTLAESCCDSMFANCIALKQSPHLLAPTLVSNSYQFMFSGCSSLERVDAEFTSWLAGATSGWMSNVASTGTFYGPCELKTTTRNMSSVPASWKNDRTLCEHNGLIFISSSENTKISFTRSSEELLATFEYLESTATNWETVKWQDYIFEEIISLHQGDTLYIRTKAANSTFSNATGNYHFIINEGLVTLAGNIMYLLSPDGLGESVPNYAFRGLFENGSIQTVADSLLPANELAIRCYDSMFAECDSLVSVPTNLLPARELADSCYYGMFFGCDNLSNAPTLQSTTLAKACYHSMFKNCLKLTSVPALPSETLFEGCYQSMFENDSSLSSIDVVFTDWNESSKATENWLAGVAENGTFNAPCDLLLKDKRGQDYIPQRWVIKDTMMVLSDTAGDLSPILSNKQDYCSNNVQIQRIFIKNGNYNTLCLPFNCDSIEIAKPSHPLYGSSIYELADAKIINDTLHIVLNQIRNLVAGVPYMVRWDKTLDTLLNPIFPNALSQVVDIAETHNKISKSGLIRMLGILTPFRLTQSNIFYILDGQLSLQWASSSDEKIMNGFRAYFEAISDSVKTDMHIVIHKDTSTLPVDPIQPPIEDGVQNIKSESDSLNTRKLLQGGDVIIIRNGKKYNLLGDILK